MLSYTCEGKGQRAKFKYIIKVRGQGLTHEREGEVLKDIPVVTNVHVQHCGGWGNHGGGYTCHVTYLS